MRLFIRAGVPEYLYKFVLKISVLAMSEKTGAAAKQTSRFSDIPCPLCPRTPCLILADV